MDGNSILDTRLRDVMGAILDLDPEALNDATSAETVEAWDSVHHMNLVIAVEDEFGVRLPENEIANLTSFPALREALMRLTAGGPAS
jgi:acyl carrier protein